MSAYLKIDGIPGEATEAGYEDQIIILSLNHGVSQPTRMTGGGGGGRAKKTCDHQDFNVTKVLDKASPILAQKCSVGDVFPEITLVLLQSSGDKPIPYMEYKFTNCLISSISIGGGGDDYPIENMSINYSKIVWTYTPQGQDGKAGGKTSGSWNLETVQPT